MALTVTEMESAIRARLNEPSQSRITSAEILQALNDGYKDVSALGLGIENMDVVFTKAGERFIPYSSHKVNFVWKGEAFFGGGGGGGAGGWWQEAVDMSANSNYISVMSRDRKQLEYFKNIGGAWNLLGVIAFPTVINGVTVTSLVGFQGQIWADDNFVIFLSHVYVSMDAGMLISVMNLKSKVINTSLITASTLWTSEKSIVAYSNGTILISYKVTNFPTVSKTEDYGVTWETIVIANVSTGADVFIVKDEINDIVYAVTSTNVYKSSDRGDTWTNTATGQNFGYYDICFWNGSLWIIGGNWAVAHTLWKLTNGVVISIASVPYTNYYPNITGATSGLVVYEPHYSEFAVHGPYLIASGDGITWVPVVDLSVYTMPYNFNVSLSSDGDKVAFVACGMTGTVEEFRLIVTISEDIFNTNTWIAEPTPVSWYVPQPIFFGSP